jgi:hypothetical protein
MWWKTLGVRADADIDTIKKAYSALIKTYRPEQHPEQFSQIRQAFETARKQASKRPRQVEEQQIDTVDAELAATETSPTIENDQLPPVLSSPVSKEEPVRIEIAEQPPQPRPLVTPIIKNEIQEENIITLLEHWKQSRYKNQQYINRVLNHPHTHDFYELKQAGHQVFAWLIENIKPASGILATSINMPVKELARLNSLFGWSLKERDLYEHYKDYDLSLVFFGIASGQSARLHRNPIVLQKAEEKKKDKYVLFEKLVSWGTGIILMYLFIMLIVLFVGHIYKGRYFASALTFLIFYLSIDGLYYSFSGLKKVGLLKPAMITRRSKMWALIIKQLFLGFITLSVIIVLEAITLFIVYSVGEALIRDKEVVLVPVLLVMIYVAYRLNKAVFSYSRLRYFQLIRELEQIRISSKK